MHWYYKKTKRWKWFCKKTKSTFFGPFLDRQRKRLKITTTLHAPGETRWNSAQEMFSSFLVNKEALIAAWQYESDIDLKQNGIWYLFVVMKPIAPVLDKLQGESLPTINLVLPQLSSLMLGYQEMDGEFGGVIAKLIRSLNDYFNPNDLLYRFEAEEYKKIVLVLFLILALNHFCLFLIGKNVTVYKE
mmetsp:Transcript_82580/g.123934  ORF Transcript_82580/g.123934 Transcript_82580/m.123934 type:complete len:188 (+) Transcript_82580:112-675(+)